MEPYTFSRLQKTTGNPTVKGFVKYKPVAFTADMGATDV